MGGIFFAHLPAAADAAADVPCYEFCRGKAQRFLVTESTKFSRSLNNGRSVGATGTTADSPVWRCMEGRQTDELFFFSFSFARLSAFIWLSLLLLGERETRMLLERGRDTIVRQ